MFINLFAGMRFDAGGELTGRLDLAVRGPPFAAPPKLQEAS